MEDDKWDYMELRSIEPGRVLDSYRCMSEEIRRVYVVDELTVTYRGGERRSQTDAGFMFAGDSLFFVSSTMVNSETDIDSAFVCAGLDLPGKLFKDAFPDAVDAIILEERKCRIKSSPSMLFAWKLGDTLPIRGDDARDSSDCHVDVSAAADRISKYMKTPARPLSVSPPSPISDSEEVAQPIVVNIQRKRPKDAREFREQILSNGAQAEFFVWSHIKARYGDKADLSWWLTSTKRQFFPNDYSPVDDSIGSDFFIPKDEHCLFASTRGSPVHVEVKGTGRSPPVGEDITFEISRNELKMAQDAQEKGEEYVVAVVSGLNGLNRPKLELVVRDLNGLQLVPTRFLASVKKNAEVRPSSSEPQLIQSSWYR
jgi:hypothetical protein